MTTAAAKRKTAKKQRIREEFLPDSAKYATIDEREYLLIPVEDFAGWYEDIEDRAVLEYVGDSREPAIPAEVVRENLRRARKAGKA